MKMHYDTGILLVSFIALASFFSCNKAAYTSSDISDAPNHAKTDSTIYMLTVDSVSLPIKLNEIGDFPVYSKGTPQRFRIPSDSVNYKDTKYLHFLNGHMIEGRQKDRILRKLRVEDIISIEVWPSEQAIAEYGQKAANGVIFIETQRKNKLP